MLAKSLKLAEGMGFEPTIGSYPYNGLAIPFSRIAGIAGNPRKPQETAKNRCRSRRESGERNRFATAREGAQRHAGLLSGSRRAISRSTASRTKSVRSSPGANTAAMRANVPSGNRACISSDHRFFRPTRDGVSHTRFRVEAVSFLISETLTR